MDKDTLDYLESLKEVINHPPPREVPDEYIWIEIVKCLVNNSNATSVPGNSVCDIADYYLNEFKLRFREG